MSNENLQPTVVQMIRMTGANTANFLEQIAEHIEMLEQKVAEATKRIEELESTQNATD
jgi:hypothetical protein